MQAFVDCFGVESACKASGDKTGAVLRDTASAVSWDTTSTALGGAAADAPRFATWKPRDRTADSLGNATWKEAHQKLLELAAERASLDFEEGRWFLSALRSDTHRRMGYASFAQYVERLFGYGRRFTQEKLRVAEALEELPATSEALRTGGVSFSTVRELTRVAIPSTEQAWLRVARGKTARDVERLVSGQRPGSLPGDVPEPGLERHTLRFEVTGEVLATFREAMAKIRRDAGEPLDDDAALLALARLVLGGREKQGARATRWR